MPTPIVLTLPANDPRLRAEVEQGLAPYARIYEPPPVLGIDLDQVKLVLDVVGQAVGVAGGVAGIFTFLWAAKDRAAKAHRRTNIKVARMGEPPLALDDMDEALLRRLLGVEGQL
jgi:hypothetical protein